MTIWFVIGIIGGLIVGTVITQLILIPMLDKYLNEREKRKK